MKQYFNWGLVFCLVCFGLKGFTQDITVSAKLDKATIALGDQTILRLNADLPVNGKISFPVLSDTISSKIQLVEIGKTDTLKDQQNPLRWKLSIAYTITSFDAGIQIIPSLIFSTASGKLKTDPLPLEVKSVAVDTTKAIYDIKQPLAVSYSFMDWLRDHVVLVAVIFACLVLVAGLWYYLKKRKKELPAVEEVKPAIPADVVALDKLKTLKDKKLWEQGQVKQYYSELTDIIREFLEKRYRVRAMEQTSDEIFTGLRHMEIPELNRNRLRQVLMLADLVKFAKQIPLNTDNEQSMDNAISFVKDAREMNQLPENKATDELI